MYPDDSIDSETLLKHADTAMYQGKSEGRGSVRFFTAAMNTEQQQRADLEQRLDHALHSALANDALQLHYQPKIDTATGAVIGAEALLRWPDAGLVALTRSDHDLPASSGNT